MAVSDSHESHVTTNQLKGVFLLQFSGERLLQTLTLIGQEVELPSFGWTTATELYLLSDQSMSL